MGILDSFANNPAAQQGLLAMGLSMLANNRGGVSTGQALGQGGLTGMNAYAASNQTQREAEKDALAAQLAQQQISQSDVETQVKQQQLAQAQRTFDMQQNILKQAGFLPPDAAPVPSMLGTQASPANAGGSALSGAMAAAGQGTNAAPMQAPAMTPAAMTATGAGGAPGAPAAAGGGMSGVFAGMSPEQRVAFGLTAAGMKDMAGVITPDYDTLPNGIQINKKTGQPTGRTFPVTDSQGHAIQMVSDGQGGFSVAIPQGSLASFTSFQNAQEASKAGFDLKTVKDRQGNEYYTTSANIISQLPGAQGGQGGQPAQGTGGGPAGTGPMANVSPHVAQAYQLGNEDFMKRSYAPTLDAGDAATGDLAQITAMRNIDPATGWGKEAQGKAAAFLGSMGVPGMEKFAGTQQEFNNVALSKLQQNLALQTGPQTEGDAQRAAKTFASLGNTPDANKFILDYAQAQAEQKQRRADYYRDALPLAQSKGDLSEIDRRWRKIQGSIWDAPQLQQYRKPGQ